MWRDIIRAVFMNLTTLLKRDAEMNTMIKMLLNSLRKE